MEQVQKILNEYNRDAPLEEAVLIPQSWYLSPEIYALERKTVFREGWQYAGRTAQLEKPGSFITADLAGESVIVARNRENKLVAMSNICRHKATKIMHAKEGHVPAFSCRYHGWTYDLNGTLKATPEFTCERGFDKAQHSLPRFQALEAGPFVFVALTNEEVSLFTNAAGPLMEKVNALSSRLKWYAQKTYDVECNWKVYVDNYMDGGYHINTVHPALSRSLNYKNYETKILGRTVLQHSPMEKNTEDTFSVRTGTEASYFWLMPNLMVNLYNNVMDTNWVIPTGPDKCRVVFDFYFGIDDQVTDAFKNESIRMADLVQDEDKDVCESVQKGLGSHFYKPGRFCVKRENGNHHFHLLLAESLSRYSAT